MPQMLSSQEIALRKEKFYFQISYLGIKGATATIEVRPDEHGHQIYAYTQSEPWVDKFYPVRNHVWCEFKGKVLTRFEFNQNEGKKKRHRKIEFHRDKKKAFHHDVHKNELETFDIQSESIDPLSAFFYVRNMPLKPGVSVFVDLFDNKKNYRAEVKVLRRQEITVQGKKYKTIVVKPELLTEGVFMRKGDIFLYLTDDEKKIPVMMESRIFLGRIKAFLEKVE